MSSKKTVVVNLFGGPGTGKSVTKAMLYAMLATSHRYGTVEEISEYAKELAWEINKDPGSSASKAAEKLLRDQIHVTAVQTKRVKNICGQADIIVSDSPVRIGKIYYEYNMAEQGKIGSDEYRRTTSVLNDLIWEVEAEHEEVNIFLERSDEVIFQKEGRVHDMEDSKKIDKMIKAMLEKDNIPFISITNKMDIVSVIGEIEKHLIHKNLQSLGIMNEEDISRVVTDSDIDSIVNGNIKSLLKDEDLDFPSSDQDGKMKR